MSFPIIIKLLDIKEGWAMLEVNFVLFSLITKNIDVSPGYHDLYRSETGRLLFVLIGEKCERERERERERETRGE